MSQRVEPGAGPRSATLLGQEATPPLQTCVTDGAASLPPQGRELRCPVLEVGSSTMQAFLVVSAKALGSPETNK